MTLHRLPCSASFHRLEKTGPGPLSTYCFQPLSVTSSQTASTSAMASSLGQAAAQALRAIRPGSFPACGGPSSRRSSPCRAWSVAMAPHLLAQPVGELGRPPRTPPAESIRRGPPRGTWYSSMTRPGRLLSTITRSPRRAASRTLWVTNSTVSVRSRADPLQLVVQQVAGHRVERAERLVHQQHVGVLGQRPGQRHPLAHAAGQLVRALVAEPGQVHGLQQLPARCLALAPGHAPGPQGQLDVARPRSATGTGPAPGTSATTRPPAVSTCPRWRVQPGHQRQQRALAAAGGADQADELAVGRRSATPCPGPARAGRRGRRPWTRRSADRGARRRRPGRARTG